VTGAVDGLDDPRLHGATVVRLATPGEHAAFAAGEQSAGVVVLDGVLGRLTDPLVGLRAVHARCTIATVVRAPALALGGRAATCLWEFGDDGWTPTRAGLEGLCRAAGFARTELLGAAEPSAPAGAVVPWELVMRAWW
jgi:hypothetical protein